MAEILHILRYKLLSFIKINLDWSATTVLKNIASFLVYGGFAVGTYFFTRVTISFLLDHAHIGLFLLHRFLSMLLFVFFLSINAGNMIVSYSTLYKSSEVPYFLSKPVGHASVFVIKFLENFFYSSTTLLLIGFAVLLGYGSYFEMPWTFYVFAVLLLILPFMLIAALLGAVMLIGLTWLASRIGLRAVIVSLAALYVGSIYLFFTLTNPMNLVAEVMKFYPYIDAYYGFLEPAFARFLPNHWVSESLYWIVLGHPERAFLFPTLLVSVCGLLAIIAYLVARRFYYRTWNESFELRTNRHSSLRMGWLEFETGSILEPQTEVILKKEFWQFFREPSQWIHLSVVLLLMAIFVGSIIHVDIVQSPPFLQAVSYLVVFLFGVFLVISVALRFVYPMMSIEGEAFWKARSAPLSAYKIACLKFLAALVVLFIMAEVLNTFVHFPLMHASALWLSSSINTAFLALALVSLNFGMGAIFVTYKESNPIRVASSQGASLTFLLSLAFMVLLVAVLFYPINNYFQHASFLNTDGQGQLLWATLAIAAVSTCIAVFFFLVTKRVLLRDF
jgi:ABC-2 type transport system permease protein